MHARATRFLDKTSAMLVAELPPVNPAILPENQVDRANDRRATDPNSDAVNLLIGLGTALHQNGAPAHRLESAMLDVAAALGVRASFFSTPTVLLTTFGPSGNQRTEVIRVQPGDVHLGRLAALDALSSKVADGELTVTEAEAALVAIAEEADPYSRVGHVAATALASSSAAVLLGGGVSEAMASLAAGAMVGLLGVARSSSPSRARLLLGASGFLAAFICGFAATIWPLSVPIATVAGLILLVPGLTLTVAMTELASRHLASGVARLLDGLAGLMQIAFGSLLGARLVAAIAPPLTATPEVLGSTIEWLCVLAAGICLTVLFRAIPRHVGLITLASLLGWAVVQSMGLVFEAEIAVFSAALAVGIAGNATARWLRIPASVVLVPGVILLVPGAVGFRSVTHLMANDVVSGVASAFMVALLACALAAGLLVAHAVIAPRRSL